MAMDSMEPSSSAVTVTIDSTGLVPGSYSANLCVASNDPDSALLAIPVDLTVVQELEHLYLPLIKVDP